MIKFPLNILNIFTHLKNLSILNYFKPLTKRQAKAKHLRDSSRFPKPKVIG